MTTIIEEGYTVLMPDHPQPKGTKPVRTDGLMIRQGSGSHRTYGSMEFADGEPCPENGEYDQEWMRHASEDFGGA